MAQVNPIIAWTRLVAWPTLAEPEGCKAHALLVESMDYPLVMVARLFDADVNHHTAAAQSSRKNANRSPQLIELPSLLS